MYFTENEYSVYFIANQLCCLHNPTIKHKKLGAVKKTPGNLVNEHQLIDREHRFVDRECILE